jgi:hypothetical protein|tara:strand:+ start:16593 stop:16934 length:342 start_codon:yes stop_codon:yes gene_type:complete
MATLRARLVDKNRYSKRYPLIRAPRRLTYMGDTDIEIEIGSIYFNNTDTGTLTYDAQFPDTGYQILVAARNGSDSGGANVNLYISEKNTGSVLVKSSAPFTGYVDVFAVRLGS